MYPGAAMMSGNTGLVRSCFIMSHEMVDICKYIYYKLNTVRYIYNTNNSPCL